MNLPHLVPAAAFLTSWAGCADFHESANLSRTRDERENPAPALRSEAALDGSTVADDIRVLGVTANGSGCPSGTVQTFEGPTATGQESFSYTDRRPDDNFSVWDTTARLIINVAASLLTEIDETHPSASGYIRALQLRNDGSPPVARLAVSARRCAHGGTRR